MNLSPVFRQRFFDSNGLPLAGGQLYTYAAGTTTPQVTYSNSTGTTNTNPVVLDAYGYADVWLDPTLAYKFILEDANDNVLWTVDQVSYPLGITTWSENTTYSPGDIVADSSGYGLFYVSLGTGQGNALTDTSAWRVLMGNTRTVSTNTSLAVTDDLIRSNSTSGALTHVLPACSTTPVGKKITIKDVGTGGNSTTLQGNGTDTIDGSNIYGVKLTEYGAITVTNNGSSWDAVSFNASNGGAVVSSSSGDYVGTNASYAQVTNLSVTVSVSNRPVLITLQGDGTTNSPGSVLIADGNSDLELRRGSTVLQAFEIPNGGQLPPGVIFFIDTPGSGSFTYSIWALTAVSITVAYCVLAAVPL